ncbi:MAG: cytochrome B [Methylophilaceae bacterium 17-44-8]|nr:MAG: cytochrome B [Methylophilales bacterium 28-44-11]OYZ03707.1 MAG: cytochrome B [Methylophilales bacterium 16-45-7]OZA06629.1 MAG: cytochrome B [Methylophilaceae bacterium 17-44-8]
MTTKTTPQHYHKTSITLHWVMLLLMIAVYACIELRELYPKGSDIREGFKTWHFMLGLSVLMLASFRLIFRVSQTTPPIQPAPVQWQMISAHIVHAFLYILMIAVPIGGWLILSASGKTIPFFGLSLPALIDENKELAKTIKNIHTTVGEIGYYVIALHTVAALFHHYVVKDNTLLRMLPKK